MSGQPIMKTTTTKRQFEVTTWLDTESPNGPDPKYGIKTRVNRGEWLHCGENRKLLLFDSPAEAKERIKDLRKRYPAINQEA